ncbi:type I-MYXAN CRISPR-associated endonuclease Cas1 [Myxococcota bacterium]|nr:type I-MYXAN CRISPR-associated endonuclease Cas1 [Myxococcota bacterium]
MEEDLKSPEEGLLRVMALHALVYCERLFFLEEVEELRVADSAVFAGRTLHEELRRTEEEDGEWTSLSLSSESLGLVGKMDAVRKRDGQWIPYEHKKGRSMRGDRKPQAWPSDALQVAAYAMLLEEHYGCVIEEGRIRYHAEKITVRVLIDSSLREAVRSTVLRARALRASLERPPITTEENRCLRCSLAPVCLPEEERHQSDPTWATVRLFPPHQERKTLHIVSYQAQIGRAGDTLKIRQEGEEQTYPIHEVGTLVLYGTPQITTQALHSCLAHDIAVHWVTRAGRYLGGISAGVGAVQRKLRHYEAFADASRRLGLCRRLISAKIENSLRFLLRATRGEQDRRASVEDFISEMRRSLKSVTHAEDENAIRGFEGNAARAYFAALPFLISSEVDRSMLPKGRSKRPPKDRFNALLSFGYALVYQRVLQAILVVGLEPALGFFHTPRSAAHPLALDLMELFRCVLWDMPLVASVNRRTWGPDEDFSIVGEQVWLSEHGRKKAIQIFERRLEETWNHPAVDYSLSYARMVELEVRLLEKEWTGSPGLFAQFRIR